MSQTYESPRPYHKLLSALLEMRDMGSLLERFATNVSERTDYPLAKELFDRWAQESAKHCQTCQYMIVYYLSLLTGDCKTCMKDIFDASFRWARIPELPELSVGSLEKEELCALVKKYLTMESEAERRFSEITEMTDDRDAKNLFIELSEAKKKQLEEIQQFINMSGRTYGKTVEM